MNHYPHHIGDFNNATRHLTRIERSIYRDLLDLYYDTEKPLPNDLPKVMRRILCDERDACIAVIEEFFTLDGDEWHNKRCDEEIDAYRRMAEGGKRGAAKRWASPPHSQPIATPSKGQWQPEPEPEPEPEPKKEKARKRAWAIPDWIPAKEWGDFETHRAAIRGVPFTDAARDGVVRELKKLCDMGSDAGQLLSAAVTNGWRTVYPPRVVPIGAHVNKQEAIEASNRAVGDRWLAEQESTDAVR